MIICWSSVINIVIVVIILIIDIGQIGENGLEPEKKLFKISFATSISFSSSNSFRREKKKGEK